jgi:mRNA interferase RelE/StbE
MYEVRLSRRANRYYQRVDSDTARRLDQCFEDLSQNPFSPGNVRPIRGRRGLYRYRVGGLRVIFSVERRERVVMVTAIGPRGDIF